MNGWDLDSGAKFSAPVSTGSNNMAEVGTSNLGPIPPGKYGIYKRPGGMVGLPAFILDPIDGKTGNDKWDGGTGRGAFRSHVEVPEAPRKGSNGCPVMSPQNQSTLADLLNKTTPGPVMKIVSPNSGREPDVWTGPRLGTLTVTR